MSDLSLKNRPYLLVCLVVVVAGLLIVISACHRSTAPAMSSSCEIALAAQAGDSNIDHEIARLQQQIRSNAKPFQTTSLIEKLGWSFVDKARESFDPGYYKLAEQCALCLESKQKEIPKIAGQANYAPSQSDAQSGDQAPVGPLSTPGAIHTAALLLRGHALENMHHFNEAEKIGRELVEKRGLAYDFGLLGDSLIEQGKIDEAVFAYQKMMNMRPGPQAYDRAAYVRWLRGDTEGARALMLLSAKAAGETESGAWAWSKLAMYELQSGDIKGAGEACGAALRTRTDYAPALFALGRIDLAENKNGEAVDALERAARLNPIPEYQWALADALSAANRKDDAAEVERRLEATGKSADPRSFALFLATRGRNTDVALRLAEDELKVRRDIYTLDALAWAQNAKGDTAEAWNTMRSALALGTADARLYMHAAAISAQAGDAAQAKVYIAKAEKFAFSLLPSEKIRLNQLKLV